MIDSANMDNKTKSNRKAMNRNRSNQKANPALKTKAGNKTSCSKRHQPNEVVKRATCLATDDDITKYTII